MFYKVRKLLQDRVAAWAGRSGVPAPQSVPLAPAPEHVDADVALAWALAASKAAKRKPLDIAGELATELKDPLLASASPAPPGFVNLRLSQEALLENLAAIRKDPAHYGTPEVARGGKVLIEFVSGNPTGPLHLASGRSAALGDSLARILRRLGTEVYEEYYVNDAGRQYQNLGLSVKARWDQALGKAAELPEGGYEGEYIKEAAAAAPPEAEAWDAPRFARFAVDRFLALHRADMERYRVRFDNWFLESGLHESGAIPRTVDFLKSRGMVYEKEGAVWLGTSGEDSEDDKDRVLVKSDGRPTYFLPDIAYHKSKYDRGWDTLIDIWGADHHGYVPRMKAAIAALGKPPEAFHAIVHQLVHLVKGEELVKMSKRKGNFVTLEELMEGVGVDACRFFFAMHTPNTHMTFDYELAKKRSQENPVFYVQYVHARICSIFREAEEQGLHLDSRFSIPDSELREPEARGLLRELFWFPRALEASAQDLSPHHVSTYLMGLAGLYHKFYEHNRVVEMSAKERSLARLALCDGVRQVISEGLGLLGVSAPEKM